MDQPADSKTVKIALFLAEFVKRNEEVRTMVVELVRARSRKLDGEQRLVLSQVDVELSSIVQKLVSRYQQEGRALLPEAMAIIEETRGDGLNGLTQSVQGLFADASGLIQDTLTFLGDS